MKNYEVGDIIYIPYLNSSEPCIAIITKKLKSLNVTYTLLIIMGPINSKWEFTIYEGDYFHRQSYKLTSSAITKLLYL